MLIKCAAWCWHGDIGDLMVMAYFLHMTRSSDPQFHVTHRAGVPLVTCTTILMEWTKLWSPKVVDSVRFSFKSSMWHLWLATLVSENWLMHSFKGFGVPSCMKQWLPLFIHAWLMHKQKTVLQSSWFTTAPSSPRISLLFHAALVLPLIYHSLMDVT